MSIKRLKTDRFWNIVDAVEWARDCDYDRCKAEILRRLVQENGGDLDEAARDAEVLFWRFHEATGTLDRALTRAGVDSLYGDSHGDLLAHIVGLGRERYEALMSDPDKVADMAGAGEFRESFSYSVPTREDVRKLDPGASEYISRASDYLGGLDTTDYPDEVEETEAYDTVVAALEAVVKGYGFTIDASAAREACEDLHSALREAEAAFGHHVQWRGPLSHHGINNLFRDLAFYREVLTPDDVC